MIDAGRLYLAVPPLFRLQHGGKIFYARNDAHKDQLLKASSTPMPKSKCRASKASAK